MKILKVKVFSRDFFAFLKMMANPFWFFLPVAFLIGLSKKTEIILAKKEEAIVGGFILTGLAVNKYRPDNIFNKRSKRIIEKELLGGGYKYLVSFVVGKKYRGCGIGTEMLKSAVGRYPEIKIYGEPFTERLRTFYKKLGAREFIAKDGKPLAGKYGEVLVYDS